MVDAYFPTVRYENLYPDGTKLRDLAETTPNIAGVRHIIEQIDPALVVVLGEHTSIPFLNKDVKSWRGSVIPETDRLYLVTYHPRDAYRQNYSEENPGQIQALIKADLKKAKRLSVSYKRTEITLVTNPSFHEAMAELDRLMGASILGFDIETINKKSICMDCIGFSDSPNWGICIPIGKAIGKEFQYHYSFPETVELLAKIAQLLESDVPKVAQNALFDTVVLSYVYKIKVANLVWDTMCAAHNMYCELPKDLGSLLALFTDLPYHKHKIHGSQVEYWEYNAMDAVACTTLYPAERQEMEELGILTHYMTVTNPLLAPLREMQVVGVKVDEPLLEKAKSEEEEVMREMESLLTGLIKGFNAGSPAQVKNLIYDVFKFPKKYGKATGNLTSDINTLMEFAKISGDRRVRIVLLAILVYKHCQHQIGVLKTPLVAGRMHCAYSAWGTETGRLNSTKSIIRTWIDGALVPVGTNLQNLKKGIHRQILIGG